MLPLLSRVTEALDRELAFLCTTWAKARDPCSNKQELKYTLERWKYVTANVSAPTACWRVLYCTTFFRQYLLSLVRHYL